MKRFTQFAALLCFLIIPTNCSAYYYDNESDYPQHHYSVLKDLGATARAIFLEPIKIAAYAYETPSIHAAYRVATNPPIIACTLCAYYLAAKMFGKANDTNTQSPKSTDSQEQTEQEKAQESPVENTIKSSDVSDHQLQQ